MFYVYIGYMFHSKTAVRKKPKACKGTMQVSTYMHEMQHSHEFNLAHMWKKKTKNE